MNLIVSLKKLTKEAIALVWYKSAMRKSPMSKVNKNRFPLILYYHRLCDKREDCHSSPELVVSAQNFEKQMEFIKEHMTIVPLDAIVKQIKDGKNPDCKYVAITFDDGYVDNYSFAYPILKKYNIPATIFVTTGFVGSNRLFWWDKLNLMLKGMNAEKVDLQDFPSKIFSKELKCLIRKGVSQGKISTSITDYLKAMGAKIRNEVIAYLEENIADIGSLRTLPRLFLSWDEIREMNDNGITFGSHSHNHSTLTELSDEDIGRELSFSKELLGEKVGAEVKAFSYPDGCVDDRVKRHVTKAGYEYGVQTHRLRRNNRLDLFAMPRRMIKESHSRGYFEEFSKSLFYMELSGTFDHLLLRECRKKNPYEYLDI